MGNDVGHIFMRLFAILVTLFGTPFGEVFPQIICYCFQLDSLILNY